jgi:hypothetical protein
VVTASFVVAIRCFPALFTVCVGERESLGHRRQLQSVESGLMLGPIWKQRSAARSDCALVAVVVVAVVLRYDLAVLGRAGSLLVCLAELARRIDPRLAGQPGPAG